MRTSGRDVLLICICIVLFVSAHILADLIMPAAGAGVPG